MQGDIIHEVFQHFYLPGTSGSRAGSTRSSHSRIVSRDSRLKIATSAAACRFTCGHKSRSACKPDRTAQRTLDTISSSTGQVAFYRTEQYVERNMSNTWIKAMHPAYCILTLISALPMKVAPKNCQKGIWKWPQQMPHRSNAAFGHAACRSTKDLGLILAHASLFISASRQANHPYEAH